jgi:hypothetical protein
MVVEWLCRFKAIARPYVARGAKTLAINSTGASMTPRRRVQLRVGVSENHLHAKLARNTSSQCGKRSFKVTRREHAEHEALRLPAREEFVQ